MDGQLICNLGCSDANAPEQQRLVRIDNSTERNRDGPQRSCADSGEQTVSIQSARQFSGVIVQGGMMPVIPELRRFRVERRRVSGSRVTLHVADPDLTSEVDLDFLTRFRLEKHRCYFGSTRGGIEVELE